MRASEPGRQDHHFHGAGPAALATVAALLLVPAVLACEPGPSADRSLAASNPAVEASGLGPPSDQSGKTAAAKAFDGSQALMHARTVVAFGPRPVGSHALEQTRKYTNEALGESGLTVRRDDFVGHTPVGEIPMANLIAEIPAADGSTDGTLIVLAGHYDTVGSDEFEFVGANDAGSSTAILIELGRVLVEHPAPLPVWLVFFDGEEALVRWSDTDSRYGSRHMAERMEREGTLDRIGALILFDMIGDADLGFPKDGNSTGWLNDLIWATADQIGYSMQFQGGFAQYMEDDHLPFIRRGVAAVDLIDFDYGPANSYWHTAADTIDKLDTASFQAVGETVLSSLPTIARRISAR